VLVERCDAVHEGGQFAEQFYPNQPAADDHEREELRLALRVGFHVGALEPFDDVVAQQQGVGEGLEREGVLRTGDHGSVRLGPQGQDQLVVGELASLPGGTHADHPAVQLDALDGGLDEPGGAQEGPDGCGAAAQVKGSREHLEQQGRHEHEVVAAHQDDFHVRPPPEEPFQVVGGGDSPETAAEDQKAFLRCGRVHETLSPLSKLGL
jgi:hypothetical protein